MNPNFVFPLTGNDLLNKIAEMNGASREEIALACGYTKTHRKSQVPDVKAYCEAILDAHSIDIGPAGHSRKRGRARSYSTSVDKRGVVTIRFAYTNEAGWRPDDTIGITVCDGQISLCRTGVCEKKKLSEGEGELCPF